MAEALLPSGLQRRSGWFVVTASAATAVVPLVAAGLTALKEN